MRIAQVVDPWRPVPSPKYGACELVVDGLCRGLTALGHDVVLFAASDSTCPVERWPGLMKSQLELFGEMAVAGRHALDVYQHLDGFDIVHDHTLLGLVVSQAHPELRMVTTLHGGFNDILEPLMERLVPRVTIVANSRAHAAQTSLPTVPILHGIDTGEFRLGGGDGGYLLFLGRMSPLKGVHVAVRIAREAGLPLKIAARLAEDGEKRYFATEVQPLLGDDVEFIGEAGGADKVALLANAAALLNPVQWDEPFGLVNVEAMASGTPVIAFPRGALPEIVEDGRTGFLCADDASMVAACARIREIDRAECRRVAEERFSHTRMASDYARLFTTLM